MAHPTPCITVLTLWSKIHKTQETRGIDKACIGLAPTSPPTHQRVGGTQVQPIIYTVRCLRCATKVLQAQVIGGTDFRQTAIHLL